MPVASRPCSLQAYLLFAAASLPLVAQVPSGGTPPASTNQATMPEPATQAPPLDATTKEALDRLAQLLAKKRAELPTADQSQKAALENELLQLGWQFAGLASRTDVQDFEAPVVRQFDLQQELEQLIRPLLQTLKEATAEPRQIAELQGRIDVLQQRQRFAELALRAVERTRDQLPSGSPAHTEAQREVDQRWKSAIDSIRGELVVLRAQLSARQQGQTSLFQSVSQTAQNFVQSSGLSLLLAAAVFCSVLFGLRWLQNRLLRRRSIERGFSLRLIEVAFTGIGLVLAIAATLVVPYWRNDWLLLAICIVFLLGVGWVLMRMLPQFVEQIRLVLNIGAVREGERIEVDGLPYRVEQLRLYSRLHNPALQGGTLRMPIQDLVGKRSRRSGADEPWFPSQAGDSVLLADGTFGQVLQQTPTIVVVEQWGTPRTYATPSFLAQQPRNLSRGFVVDTTIGLDYRHAGEATIEIPNRLREAVHRGLLAIVPTGHLKAVEVQFQSAAASTLEFLVFAAFAGESAPSYASLRRTLQGLCIDACNKHGWSIPFPQLVVHRAAAP